MLNLNGMMSVVDCAKEDSVSRAAIYRLIKIGRLQAYKDGGRLYIRKRDYEEMKRNKYKRFPKDDKGMLIFTPESGNMSAFYARQYIEQHLKIPFTINHLYYSIYREKLSAKRIGYTWVLNISELDDFILCHPRSKYIRNEKKPKKSTFV